MAYHNAIGSLGESIAQCWLEDHGYETLEQNYRKKWGEIDIIARKSEITHFIEVKSVSHETRSKLDDAVSHGTYRPEENVHSDKLKRLGRAIETWIAENQYNGPWQIDVITVRIVPREKYARIRLIENVVLE